MDRQQGRFMDTSTETIQVLVDKLNTSLTGAQGSTHTHTNWGHTTIPTISVNDLTNTTGTTYTISPTTITYPNTVWTTNTTGNPWKDTNTSIDQAGMISLRGEKADVDINGKSLKRWMEKVEERLNILTPNPELESEWDELRKLGERYRKLEKKCKEKAEVWKKLKSMPKTETK